MPTIHVTRRTQRFFTAPRPRTFCRVDVLEAVGVRSTSTGQREVCACSARPRLLFYTRREMPRGQNR